MNSLYGENAKPFKDFDTYTHDKRTVVNYKQAFALLEAVRDEVNNNWFYDTRALIAADVFSDFMEIAEYLLSEGYKDAAAVLIGGTLEGHLRGLAPKYKVDTHSLNQKTGRKEPRKAEALNQDLCKNQAYVTGDQKNVTAWLDLRNNAAHAHYNQYTQDQAVLMLKGVEDFMKRVPA